MLVCVQVFNKVQNHKEICTKTGLAKTIRACSENNRTPSWAPETYTFSGHLALTTELQKLKKAFQLHAHKSDNSERTERNDMSTDPSSAPGVSQSESENSGKLWILKPAAMNRGKGIQIFNNFKDMETFLRGHVIRESYVVQKYIENPLLIDKRKFDVRMFVLVTTSASSADHKARKAPKVYLYPDGYVRTCSVKYNYEDVRDQSSHLTNDAVQKTTEEYGAFEDCNKLSFEQFEDIFLGKLDFERDVYSQIKKATAELFGVAMKQMKPQDVPGSFELFGLDFMVDDNHQVYLVEVNTSPALFRKGDHLKQLLPRVMEEVLQKALDPWFPPPLDASPPEKLDRFEELDLR